MTQEAPSNPPKSPQSEALESDLNSDETGDGTSARPEGAPHLPADTTKPPQSDVPQQVFVNPQAAMYLPPDFAKPPPGMILPVGSSPGAFPIQFAAQQSITAQFRSSQFPTSQELEVMERLHPGSTKQILDLVEQRQNAEIALAKSGQGFQRDDTRRANWMGFLTIAGVIVASTFLFFTGHDLGGGALLSADVLSIGAGLYLRRPEIFAFLKRAPTEQTASPPATQPTVPHPATPTKPD